MFRVIETFSGIGSQAKALYNISSNYEIVNTADWDINAISAYCMIHKGKIDTEKYKDVSDSDIIEFLKGFTLSSDGKKAMNEKSFSRLPMEVKRMLYSAIKETNNLVSITDIKGCDIPENIDLFTYSFPCQDLSLCGCWHGNKSGIAKDAHNRSGMLWEVERILLEMREDRRQLPRFLVMENVCNILSKPHEEDFGNWKSTLSELGYYNKIYRLNAKNFGIPQKRERAYMISILCNNNEDMITKIENYFFENNLEDVTVANTIKRRKLMLKDILCLDYKNNSAYKKEADASKPNDTPSRKKIYEDNDMLYDGKQINEIFVNTVTTKQDRNPNSGLITYKNYARGKTKWRYLTPRECFKLMGFDEADFEHVISNNPQITKGRTMYSTEKLIKMAGNSIVVDVLEAIFKQIMEINKEFFGERE
ncbi:MAG: DNA (cytosine-5-)-methyltransferase [Lachnospiraceae bacterium]|nr:DNA (cytosine-5-)-methyltransferase [Lachnospiraceae bacterium]